MSIIGLQVAHGHHLLMDEFLVGSDDAMDELRTGCLLGGKFEGRCFGLSDDSVFERVCLF